MKLGYSITSFHGADVTPAQAAQRVLDRAAIAHDAGYDYVETGDHHNVSGGQYLQNVPTASRLAGQFDHVAAMFLLPLYDPVLLAEQVGTMDAFADTFDFWCAVGGGRDQFDAFDVPLAERAARFEELLDVLDRLWSEDEVTVDGTFYDLDGVSVNPKADSRICIGGSAEPAVRRAGRLGDAWVAGPAETREQLRQKCEWFEDAGGGDLIVRRDVLVLPDGDRARERAAQELAEGYRGWPADTDWVVTGDAADAAEEFDRLRELGADEIVIRPMVGAHARKTLQEVARGFE